MSGIAVEDPSQTIEAAHPEGVPPLPDNATPEQKDEHWFKHVYRGDKMPQLTLRAVVMGGILGMLMAASNLYTTLSIGWSFGVAITACVMSFVIWNGMRLLSGGRLSQMSILENNCMQSTASAAGYSTGSTIATMFGALLLLNTAPEGKTSADVSTWAVQPWWLVGAFTLCTGLMGVFLAIPMKRQMINHEQLPFPSGIAAAETLKSLYSASKEAIYKAYSLVIALGAGAIVGILNTDEDSAGKIGILARAFEFFKTKLVDIQFAALYPEKGYFAISDKGELVPWFSKATPSAKAMIDGGFQPSVLLIGAGMITGLRVSLSMLAGSLLLYFFVAPRLIQMDIAHAGTAGYVRSIELVGGGTIFHVYRWALWGGTGLMVFASLTSLAMQWRTIGRAFTKSREESRMGASTRDNLKDIEVPSWWMFAGMIPIAIAMVVVQYVAFNISWWAGLIAVGMSFVLSMVACRATGETDTTPIGAMGKVMQLTFAILHPKQIIPNLASAGIAANSASSSADLLTDLKSGYLLGANPRRQFLAQFFGVFFGTLAIVPIWYLMVPTKAVLEKFPAPGTQSWYRIAQVLTQGISSLADSAKYALVIGCLLGIALPLIEKFIVPPKARKYFPSAMGLGLSWVVPFASAFSFAIGAVLTWVWGKMAKKTCETYNVPVASGLIAGESLMKALIAMTATIIGLMSSGK
jgi:OPT family oligopeptide transporter